MAYRGNQPQRCYQNTDCPLTALIERFRTQTQAPIRTTIWRQTYYSSTTTLQLSYEHYSTRTLLQCGDPSVQYYYSMTIAVLYNCRMSITVQGQYYLLYTWRGDVV